MKRVSKRLSRENICMTILFTLTLLISMLHISAQVQHASGLGEPTATVRFIPGSVNLYSAGEEFIVACVCENVYNLSGFDIQFSWNTTYLEYVNHTATVPVESHPGPITPGPYGGLLHADVISLKDEVNVTTGTYWIAYAALAPAPAFEGSGTAFVMAFRVKQVPELGADDLMLSLQFTSVSLARSPGAGGGALDATIEDGVVVVYAPQLEYPPWPLLKIMPETVTNISQGNSFAVDVYLMGDGGVNLDALWDVAGIDVIVNFNATLLEALDVTIDPDGWFTSFWSQGIFEFAKSIDNTEGTIHIAFAGYGENHTAPQGQGRLFTITFNSISESILEPSEPIYLENPVGYSNSLNLWADGGLVDTSSPVGTMWEGNFGERPPAIGQGPFELTWWEDDGDGELSYVDEVTLNDTITGFYFKYDVDSLTGTLNVTQQPFRMVDDNIWAADWGLDNVDNNGLPGRPTATTSGVYNGFGLPYWTGNFSLTYPFVSVNNVTANFYTNDSSRVLVEGVDYLVHASDDLVELLVPLDVPIVNEHWVDGVNNTLNGWPAINYPSTGIQSVYVEMNNGTARSSPNAGYANDYTQGEWWFDPDWTWELEGWWALGYYPGTWNWPDGSEWWINYTAASYLTIDYNAEPDPDLRYIEFNGSYADFLNLGVPTGTSWTEAYPRSWRSYIITGWTDSDSSMSITASDYIDAVSSEGSRTYLINEVVTGIHIKRHPWICMDDPSDEFFGIEKTVEIAGFTHPERLYCPWHNLEYSVKLPHKVENSIYTPSRPPITITLSPDTGWT